MMILIMLNVAKESVVLDTLTNGVCKWLGFVVSDLLQVFHGVGELQASPPSAHGREAIQVSRVQPGLLRASLHGAA